MPAVIITLLLVIFPTVFGIYVAFTDWRLNAVDGRQFSGLDNFRRMWEDDRFWNALKNNLHLCLRGIPIQFAIALLMAVLVNQTHQEVANSFGSRFCCRSCSVRLPRAG